jgi:hypothetical protein
MRGLERNWDRIGNTGAAVDTIQDVKVTTRKFLKGEYQGVTHTNPDTRALGWRVANRIKSEELHSSIPTGTGKKDRAVSKDILSDGHEKIMNSTLNSFNKRLQEYRVALGGGNQAGAETGEESEDELGHPDFGHSEYDSDELGAEDDED